MLEKIGLMDEVISFGIYWLGLFVGLSLFLAAEEKIVFFPGLIFVVVSG